MKMKLKNHWYKYKFDYTSLLLWIMFWTVLDISYEVKLFNLTLWMLIAITIGFRYIGLKEGRQDVANALVSNLINITVHPKVDNSEEVIVKLKDVKDGMVFSVSVREDEIVYKYIKCITDGDVVQCWNLDKHRFEEFNENVNTVIYKTKTIYMPVVKLKEREK